MPPLNLLMGAPYTYRKWNSSFLLPLCDNLGASEISDACKPLKKRSRASTDVEMASSQYRDTSDSDSRGLNDPQVGLEIMYWRKYWTSPYAGRFYTNHNNTAWAEKMISWWINKIIWKDFDKWFIAKDFSYLSNNVKKIQCFQLLKCEYFIFFICES